MVKDSAAHCNAAFFPPIVQRGSNMTGTCEACLHTNQSRSYLNHLVVASGYLGGKKAALQ
jgi:hypothetical protein